MQELQQAVEETSKRQAVVLPILQYPEPLLSVVSQPVVSDIKTDQPLQNLLDDMVATMNEARGIGLSAIQVGVSLRVLVVKDELGGIHKVINPRVVKISEKQDIFREGCLSFMGLFVNVRRPVDAAVEWWDENGEKQQQDMGGLLARAIQHEMDHLEGKTFLDHLAPLERRLALQKNKGVKSRIKKIQKIFYGDKTTPSRAEERAAKKALKLKRKAGRR